MIVIDASVMANIVGDDTHVGIAARARLARAVHAAAPDLIDVETVAVLRKRWIAKDISDSARRLTAPDARGVSDVV